MNLKLVNLSDIYVYALYVLIIFDLQTLRRGDQHILKQLPVTNDNNKCCGSTQALASKFAANRERTEEVALRALDSCQSQKL